VRKRSFVKLTVRKLLLLLSAPSTCVFCIASNAVSFKYIINSCITEIYNYVRFCIFYFAKYVLVEYKSPEIVTLDTRKFLVQLAETAKSERTANSKYSLQSSFRHRCPMELGFGVAFLLDQIVLIRDPSAVLITSELYNSFLMSSRIVSGETLGS